MVMQTRRSMHLQINKWATGGKFLSAYSVPPSSVISDIFFHPTKNSGERFLLIFLLKSSQPPAEKGCMHIK